MALLCRVSNKNATFYYKFNDSVQLQLSQPKDKLIDEEVKPYLTVSIITLFHFSTEY